MKTVDLPQGRLGELAEAVEHGGQSEPVRVYGGDLRALLAMRAELLVRRRVEDPFAEGKRADLIAKAKAATTTAAQVLVPPADLRALLAMRAELLALEAAEQEQEQLESDALAAVGAKVIKAKRCDDGKVRPVLVGPGHGKGGGPSRPSVPSDGKGRPSVRTYGFDLAHLAAFLDRHPESVREAIRVGALNPTSLGSIFASKLDALAHAAPAVADAAESLKVALAKGKKR